MIQSQEEFDACLEEATSLMENQPEDGSAQARRLADVMGYLATYTSFLETDSAQAEEPGAAERAELVARAVELERQYRSTAAPHVFTDLHPEENARP